MVTPPKHYTNYLNIPPRLFNRSLSSVCFWEVHEKMCHTSEGQSEGSFTAYEFPNGVNIIVIPYVYITVASWWWFRMWSIPCSLFYDHWLSNPNTVKVLPIKLSKVQLTSQGIAGYTFFFFFKGLRVLCKYHNALVLYIPFKMLYFSLKSAVCHPQSQNLAG